MKKLNVSITALFVMGTFVMAGGNVSQIVPVPEAPVVISEPGPFYMGLGYTYLSGTEETVYDVDAHAVTGLVGYSFNTYISH